MKYRVGYVTLNGNYFCYMGCGEFGKDADALTKHFCKEHSEQVMSDWGLSIKKLEYNQEGRYLEMKAKSDSVMKLNQKAQEETDTEMNESKQKADINVLKRKQKSCKNLWTEAGPLRDFAE